MSEGNHIGNWIALGSLIVGIPSAILALIYILDVFDDPDPSPSSVAANEADTSPDITTNTPVSVEEAQTDTFDVTNCVITVDHIGAVIREEPNHLARELVSVPSGDYQPLAATEVVFAGPAELWYQIEVDGRTGWIAYTTILIPAVSSDCP